MYVLAREFDLPATEVCRLLTAAGIRAISAASLVDPANASIAREILGRVPAESAAEMREDARRRAIEADVDNDRVREDRAEAVAQVAAVHDRQATGGELVPVNEAANRLGVMPNTIHQWIKRGRLQAESDPYQSSPSTSHYAPNRPDRPKVRRLVYINEVRALMK